MNHENLVEDIGDEYDHNHHLKRTLVQDQNVTPMETRQLTKKPTDDYVALAEKVERLDQGLK